MEKESTKINYDLLDKPDKVRAILGAIIRPLSKKIVLYYSGINYDDLSGKEKAKINAVFLEEGVEISEEKDVNLFRLGDEGRQQLDQTIDMKSVNKVISSALTKDLDLFNLL